FVRPLGWRQPEDAFGGNHSSQGAGGVGAAAEANQDDIIVWLVVTGNECVAADDTRHQTGTDGTAQDADDQIPRMADPMQIFGDPRWTTSRVDKVSFLLLGGFVGRRLCVEIGEQLVDVGA